MSSKDLDLQWFAAEDEGRTEEPSELKLKKAREEGDIPKSQELNGSVVFFFCVIMLIMLSKSIFSGCAEIMQIFFTRVYETNFKTSAWAIIFVRFFVRLVLPIALTGLASGILINIIQNKGFLFAPKAVIPKPSKIIPKPVEFIKNSIFSLKGIFKIASTIGKVIIIVVIAFFYIKKDLPMLLHTIDSSNILASVSIIAKIASKLLIVVSIIFIVMAVPDYFVTKKEFIEKMKMTKYEQKQEFKEMEGDPEVKQRLKDAQKQILEQNIPKAVKESDVVITNPTHFAVSMKYDSRIQEGPVVTAKGEDEIALRIKAIAKENNVPVVENRPLARSLYSETEVGDAVPDKYWKILAQIYAEVGKFDL